MPTPATPIHFTSRSLPVHGGRNLEQRAERLHPAWNQLSNAARSLMIRNMAQLYGDSADEPVSEYLVGYAKCDRRGEWLGGTAQAFRAAREIGVPVVNIWMPAGHLAFTSIVEQILTIEDRASRNASVVPAGAATSTEAWSTEA